MANKNSPSIDHDGLFKQLLSTFFVEFIELFFPEILEYLDTDRLEFVDGELVTDITAGKRKITDLLVKSYFQEQNYHFLIHQKCQKEALASRMSVSSKHTIF